MTKYIVKRIFSMIPALLIIIFAVFFTLSLIPSSPGRIILGIQATDEQVEYINESLGYNRPLVLRYASFIWDALHGDFGDSYISGRPVMDVILAKVPVTIKMALMSVVFASIIGIPLGILSSVKPNSLTDNILTTLALLFASVPTFWLGLMFMLVFSLTLHWLPSSGVGTWQHYVMPVLTLVLPSTGYISRLTRSTMLETIGQDYIRTARAKGAAKPRIMFIHALRNAMMPVVTSLGMSFAGLLGGTVIIEVVFGLPGLGNEILTAINKKDIPVVLAAVVFLSLAFMLIMLIIDLVYAFIDPRVRDSIN